MTDTQTALTRDTFVACILHTFVVNMSGGATSEEVRASYGALIRRYLTGLGCVPEMLDSAADHVHEQYLTTPVTFDSALDLASDLERMVRA